MKETIVVMVPFLRRCTFRIFRLVRHPTFQIHHNDRSFPYGKNNTVGCVVVVTYTKKGGCRDVCDRNILYEFNHLDIVLQNNNDLKIKGSNNHTSS